VDMIPVLMQHWRGSIPPEAAFSEAIRLERGADVINALLGGAGTPTQRLALRKPYRLALHFGHRAAIDLLRRYGALDDDLPAASRLLAAAIHGDRAEFERVRATPATEATNFQAAEHRILPWAVRRRRYSAAELLLEAGLDPKVPDTDGETALHLAVRAAAPDIIDNLLQHGADVNAKNFDGETVLDIAVAQSPGELREQILKRLLAAGARPAQDGPVLDRDEMNLLFERAADAVVSGDLQTLTALLDEELFLVHARSPRPHRATLLNYCGANGVEDWRQRTPPNAPEVAQLLLERGADPDATCNLYGGGSNTLGLMLTSAHPLRAGLQVPLLEVMLEGGATFYGARGTAGIVGAAALGRLDAVQRLQPRSAKLDIQNGFFWACACGRKNVAEYLVNHGADLAAQNEEGQTGLHLAAMQGHEAVVRWLIDRNAPLELENIWGGAVLGSTFWAVMNGSPSIDYAPIIRDLIGAGAVAGPGLLNWWSQETSVPADKKARIDEALRTPRRKP
jgi:ankyrin repeat protein